MSVRVLRAGLLTTVQDLGRSGLQQYGVAVGGAMDAVSLRIANSLVGNAESDAALEITLLGPTLQFAEDSLIALCGGDWQPHANGEMMPMNRPVWLRGGTTLNLGGALRGCRGYLAVASGIDVPLVMGSRSTYLLAKIGGHEGRALQAGDVLAIHSASPESQRLSQRLKAASSDQVMASVPWGAAVAPLDEDPLIRVLRGSEFERLTLDSQNRLFSSKFEVTTDSNRMGYRLAGPPLKLADSSELVSAAVCPGTIQVPASGQPILLTAECATTGGYCKVAHAASVDLPRVGQLKPGDFFRLGEISLAEAHNLYRRQEADLRCLQTSLRLKFAG